MMTTQSLRKGFLAATSQGSISTVAKARVTGYPNIDAFSKFRMM
jgi:hypothetical protein